MVVAKLFMNQKVHCTPIATCKCSTADLLAEYVVPQFFFHVLLFVPLNLDSNVPIQSFPSSRLNHNQQEYNQPKVVGVH